MEDVSQEQKEKLQGVKDEIQGKLQAVEDKMKQKLEGVEMLGDIQTSDFVTRPILPKHTSSCDTSPKDPDLSMC